MGEYDDTEKREAAIAELQSQLEDLEELRGEVKRLRAENAALKATDSGKLLVELRIIAHQLYQAPGALERLQRLAKEPGQASRT
jgi:hypothetical protein